MTDEHTRDPTPEERQMAQVHATAISRAWDDMRRYRDAGRAAQDGAEAEARAGCILLMALAGGYRTIANGAKVDL